MRIDFYSKDNCKFDPDLMYGKGVGGSEYALICLAEELGVMGHNVTIWNDIDRPIKWDHVQYAPISSWNPMTETDLFVIFRVSIPSKPQNAKKVVFFSCDQHTDGNWGEMFPWIDRFICISEFHKKYIASHYEFEWGKLRVCEIGANVWDYLSKSVPKIHNRFIFCSVPDRGLQHVFNLWPTLKREIPDATLMVTSDYTLWGRGTDPGNHKYVERGGQLDGVSVVNALPRKELVVRQLESEIMLYPCTYDENFCVSLAECLTAGAVPIVSDYGALPTTLNGHGIMIEKDPNTQLGRDAFIQAAVELTSNRKKQETLRRDGMEYARLKYNYIAVANRFLVATGFESEIKVSGI